MKAKTLLIITVLISATTILYGCGSNETSSDESNSTQSEIVSDSTNSDTSSNSENTNDSNNSNDSDNSKSKANSESKKDTKSNTNTKSTNKSTNSSSQKNSKAASNNNVTKKSNESTNDLTFKSKLGFSMQFPDNWKGKYKIKEDNDGLYVYFKSKDPKVPENQGLLFTIKKKYDSTEEGMLDSVGDKKFININNINYLVGGPTDISLDSKTSDFDKFVSMTHECNKVIDTIKSTN